MSTNANIKIKKESGEEKSIYVHWDGYVEHTGVILQLAYNTEEKIDKLIELGDLSCIGYHTTSRKYDKDGCVAYHRDMGEKLHFSCVEEEFNYTFDCRDKVWYVEYGEFIKGKPSDALHLGYTEERIKRYLIDVIAETEIDKQWETDEYAPEGGVVDACIAKACEARQEQIKRTMAEYNSYQCAYCL